MSLFCTVLTKLTTFLDHTVFHHGTTEDSQQRMIPRMQPWRTVPGPGGTGRGTVRARKTVVQGAESRARTQYPDPVPGTRTHHPVPSTQYPGTPPTHPAVGASGAVHPRRTLPVGPEVFTRLVIF